MKFYLIMIPFLGFFLFTGIKLHLYHDIISQHDQYSINAMYASTDLDQIRNYKSKPLNQSFENKLVKYLVLEFPHKNENTIEYQVLNDMPLLMQIMTTVDVKDQSATINKLYILDVRE